MPEEFELDANLADLEAQLGKLEPTRSQLDRDALLFRAGWEAGLADTTSQATRPITAASLAAIAAVLALMLIQSELNPNAGIRPSTAPTPENKTAAQPPTEITHVATAPSTTPARSTRQMWNGNRRLLRGRRDPERWLRETDRMVATSSLTSAERPRTIRDWYQEIPTDGFLRNEQARPAGDQL